MAELTAEPIIMDKELDVARAESQTSASNKELDVDANTPYWTPEEERRLVRKSVIHTPTYGG